MKAQLDALVPISVDYMRKTVEHWPVIQAFGAKAAPANTIFQISAMLLRVVTFISTCTSTLICVDCHTRSATWQQILR